MAETRTDNPTQLENKLEPCPWCKAVPVWERSLEPRWLHLKHGGYCVMALNEFGRGRTQYIERRFLNAWNSRAPVVAPQRELQNTTINCVTDAKGARVEILCRDFQHAQRLQQALGVARAAPSPSSPVPVEQGDSHQAEQWKRDLIAAGWVAESAIKWRAPDGGLYRGPYGAWKELQRRTGAEGLDTNWPLRDVLTQSVEWLRHLHDDHNCDCHGWEARSFLIEAATRFAATPTPVEQGRRQDAIALLRSLRNTSDPVEIQRQIESWDQLQEDLRPAVALSPSAREAAEERTIDKMHRETGIPIWALEIAFELSTLGMLDEDTTAGMRVIPDAARVIAQHHCSPVPAAGGDEDAEKRARRIVDDFRFASPPVQSLRFLEWEPLVTAIAAALRSDSVGEEK